MDETGEGRTCGREVDEYSRGYMCTSDHPFVRNFIQKQVK